MDADAKKQAARAVWEGKLSYSVALMAAKEERA